MDGERLKSAEISNLLKRRITSYADEIKPETPLDQYLTRYSCIQLLRDLHAELFPHVPGPAYPASVSRWTAANPTALSLSDSVFGHRVRTLLDADINEYKRLADSHFTFGDTLTGRGYEVAGAAVRKLRRKLFAPSVPAEADAEDLAGTIRDGQPVPGEPGPSSPRFRNHGPIPIPPADLPAALRAAAAATYQWDLNPLLLDAAAHLEDRDSQLAIWELLDDQLTEVAQDFGTPWEELEPGERLDGIRAKAEELTALEAGIGGIAKLLGIEPDADTTALELATHLQEVIKGQPVYVAGNSTIRVGGMMSTPAPIPPGPSADPAAAVVRILGMIEARRGAIRSGCPPYRDTSSALDALYGLQDEIGREFKILMPAANLGPGDSAPPVPAIEFRRLGELLGLDDPGSPDLVQRIEIRVREIMSANDKYAEDHQAFRELREAVQRLAERFDATLGQEYVKFLDSIKEPEHVQPSAPGIYIKDIEANLIKASEPPPSKSVGAVQSLPEAMRAAGASPEGWHLPTLLRQGADELAAHMEFRRRVMREIERVAGLVGVPPRPDALAMLEGIAVALVQPPPCLPEKIVAAGKRLGVDTADAPEAVLDRIEAVAGVGQKLGTAPGFIRVTTRDGWEEVVRIEDVRGYRSNADGFALNIANIGVVALSESSGCQVADVFALWTRDLTDGEI